MGRRTLRVTRRRPPGHLRAKSAREYALHWYTYRTEVGALLGLVLAVAMLWLYSQQRVCEAHERGCIVNLSVHPEDRLFPAADPPSPAVTIVGIDDRSIAALGHFPFTRDRYATVLDALAAAGAAVVAFDVGFSEEYTPSGDDAFAKAIARSSIPVILAYGEGDLNYGMHRVVMTGVDQQPLRQFSEKADVAATAMIIGDDGTARQVPMFVEPKCHVDGTCRLDTINPLSFAAYRAYFIGAGSATSVPLRYTPQGAVFGSGWKKPLSVDPHGLALINFSGEAGNVAAHRQYVSFAEVWSGKVDPQQIKGKIVLVGAYQATGIHDELRVPGSHGLMAGVEIQANILTMLLNQRFLRPESPLAVGMSLLFLSIFMGLLLARFSLLRGLLVALAAGLLYTIVMVVVYEQMRVVPDLFHVWAAIALVYTGLTGYRFLYEEREKRKITGIFGQYLKPEVVKELATARHIGELQLGGARRDLTLLFVDIRGFTSMSERLPAEDVLKVLDEYLADLTKIIFRWDGTVDKYVGDEIMALWNAPHDQVDHALRGIRCGVDMLRHAPTLITRLQERGLPPIAYGIGVNTGPAVIGNMGSAVRRQYTAIGDTVNTAARFCGVARQFELLIGQPTYDATRDYVLAEPVPEVRLKGKSADTFMVYRVIATRAEPSASWSPVPFVPEPVADALTPIETTITAAGLGHDALEQTTV